MDDVCEVVITAPDAAWLAEFTRSLVEARLCASGHNISEIRSIYRWAGEVEDRSEARVALHTRRALVPEIIRQTNQRHPYEVPCVVVIPIADGNPAYIEWIKDQAIGGQQ